MKGILLVLFIFTSTIHAHPGRYDANGCHHDRKNGGIHCKNSKRTKEVLTTSNLGIKRVDYDGFSLWIDCAKRAAIKFQYNAQRDTGNFKRSSRFFVGHELPSECGQLSAKPYGRHYDRGHMVPANHLDYSPIAITESNTMFNILPQAKNMNRGAWFLTEEIIECYRNTEELLVLGGAIWDDDTSKDYFQTSHGVRTPSKFWKVIIKGMGNDLRVIAWVIPNIQTAKWRTLDTYIVTVAEIERQTGEKIPVPEFEKMSKPKTSWIIPRGCS